MKHWIENRIENLSKNDIDQDNYVGLAKRTQNLMFSIKMLEYYASLNPNYEDTSKLIRFCNF